VEPVEITAGRLHLRPWTPYDVDAFLEGFTDPETVRWTPAPVPFPREEALRRLSEAYPRGWDEGTGATFAVVDSVSAEVLAWVALFGIEHGRAEVGWATWPGARSTGVASDAVAALCRWGFQALDREVLEAVIAVGNWGSRAVAEKCGFRVDGTRRKAMPQRGVLLDAWSATLLRGEELVDRRALPAPPVLTDGVVTLRAFAPDDAADVQRACDDPDTAHWLPVPVPYRLEDGREYVETICPMGWADGSAANFAIVDADDGSFLGDVGLKLANRHPFGIGEVGYWTAPWARNRGVASRGTALVTRWGLEQLGLNRVELVADVQNVASQRAAEKAGFVREGVTRLARPDRHGTPHDMVLFSQVAADLR
jgi:RimJ/RimL family protein N-acetyltransferase